jgi:hypothetical protein
LGHGFSFGRRGGSAGAGKGIDPAAAGTATTWTATGATAIAPALAAPLGAFTAPLDTLTAAAGAGLGALLADQLVELPLLELLGHGPQGEAEHRHGGAETEGLLQGPGRLHLIVAEADTEAAAVATTLGPAAARPFIPGRIPRFSGGR